jgi:ornithine cyclodeaminase
VALDALARPDVRSLGILGAGVQARSHLQALRIVRPGLADVRIWNRTHEKAERLARDACSSAGSQNRDLGHLESVRATGIEEAAGADVVLTATASPSAVLMGRWLKPKALVIAVGAVGAGLRELDDEAVLSSFVVAESRQAAEREAGDIVLSGARVQAEIGEILSRSQRTQGQNGPGAVAPVNGRILFKSVGMAVEDLVAARLVWKARQA